MAACESVLSTTICLGLHIANALYIPYSSPLVDEESPSITRGRDYSESGKRIIREVKTAAAPILWSLLDPSVKISISFD